MLGAWPRIVAISEIVFFCRLKSRLHHCSPLGTERGPSWGMQHSSGQSEECRGMQLTWSSHTDVSRTWMAVHSLSSESSIQTHSQAFKISSSNESSSACSSSCAVNHEFFSIYMTIYDNWVCDFKLFVNVRSIYEHPDVSSSCHGK